ncbi:Crp/Fnr family transcriptional regulator [Devosia pacifica]|uniref:Crp/Fnr family transcriptional regulator n=1 Tax=Devosia pacifica TaxID=1335967 RepID=UPI001FCE93DD|nr:Crp/Fnr family transcriptional regulator [Devosia pacifica]
MLKRRHTLEVANRPIEHAYFIEDGLASSIARMGDDRDIEIGVTGREGMTGVSAILGAGQSPHMTIMQVEGWAWAVSIEILLTLLDASVTLRQLLLRYVHTTLVQTATSALVNARARLEERLARWLLMASDRLGGNDLRLTHEFMAVMLGVRRPGVTEAMHILEGYGLVRATRGQVSIIDRGRLEEFANGAYGAYEAEYARLMGSTLGGAGRRY